MSVLIKGLKMPKEGALKVAIRDGIASVYLDEGKADYYSVVDLPDHGDLIDRDVLKDECKEPYVWWETATQMAQILSDSPVVIPAERSEE